MDVLKRSSVLRMHRDSSLLGRCCHFGQPYFRVDVFELAHRAVYIRWDERRYALSASYACGASERRQLRIPSLWDALVLSAR